MIDFSGRGILLDVEGTTSSVRYVYDVLFPYARRHLARYLETAWDRADTQRALDLIAHDAGAESFSAWTAGMGIDAARERVLGEVTRLMDGDVKATGLKELQGLIWRSGFESGQLRAHVYEDVPPALRRWQAAGLDVRIFSSGSVAAQKLFFAHTEAGNLLPYLNGHYDTTTGPKREWLSYARIAEAFGLRTAEILFASDIVEELNAARAAGMQTALLLRPGNAPAPDPSNHPTAESFATITAAHN
jgi:enolase-phosphatase E1